MPFRIGTSGWQYADWRTAFYPHDLPLRAWLPYYGDRFDVVEVNNTFYRLPRAEVFAEWARLTPPGFRFAAKVSRFLTHIKRLTEPEEPSRRFLDAAAKLGAKLGPLLLQLPPYLRRDVSRLRRALRAFPRHVRLAVEFRDESWYTDDVRRVLEARGAALCWVDRGSRLLTPTWRTADWGYVRFHAGRASPPGCYGRRALETWAERLERNFAARDDAHVFFNNDRSCCAVRDALVLRRLLGVSQPLEVHAS